MGKRREPRIAAQVPVRIFGTDAQGKIFSENVTTADISRSGVRLVGVRSQIKVGEIIGLTCGPNKVHFRVKWVGTAGTAIGSAGLQNLTPERPLWNLQLPAAVLDSFREEMRGERRQYPRISCAVGVEIRAEGEAPMWGRASDLSLGGCFVEMMIPLKPDSKFEISLWLEETKLKLRGSVASSAPGYGIGVRFEDVSAQGKELLDRFIQGIVPKNLDLTAAASGGA